MKTSMKVVAMLMAAMMLACVFTACGKDANSGDKTFLLGCTGPLTGDASSYGNSVKNGAQLAVDEVNAAGGVNGIKFTFDMKDDKATAEDAATGYDALMDAGMQISLGSVTSGSCESFASKSVADNLFFMTPSASAANVIANRDNAFRVCFGDPDQGTLAAKELAAKYEKIGAIYDNSDPYSKGIFEAFDAEMKAQNKEFSTQTFDQETKKDFSTQVEALKDCDVIFLPIYYTEAGLIAKTCAAKSCDALLYGCDGLDGVVDQIDDTVTNEIKYITPFDVNSSDAKVSAFVTKYKESFGAAPDQFAADAYDAVYAIAEAMKAANVTDASISASDLCEAVKTAITSSSFKLQGVTGTMTWDASGACNKEPQVVDIKK